MGAVPRLTSDSTLTPSAVEEVKGAEALGTPVIQPFRRAPASSVSAVAPPDWKREAMTRQRRLKRRIRARMAKTGERYSTARREVLRRLGTSVPDQADARGAGGPGQRRYRTVRRFLPGAAIVVVVGAAVAVLLIESGGEEGGQAPKQPSAERRVSPADELPPGLRELLAREHLDLDRVRSVECGAGRQAPVEFRAALGRFLRGRGLKTGGAICQIVLRSGTVNISGKVEGRWIEIVPRARAARAIPAGLTVLAPPASRRRNG